MGTEWSYLNIINAIYDKPTVNIILNGQKLKYFPKFIHSPHSPLLFNIVLEILPTAIRQEEEIKGIQIGKKEIKLSLFADDMTLYIENPKDSIKTLLNLVHEFFNVAAYKINIKNRWKFYITIMKYQEEKIRKQSHLLLQPKI